MEVRPVSFRLRSTRLDLYYSARHNDYTLPYLNKFGKEGLLLLLFVELTQGVED